jgi:hypothetical protein
MQARYLTYQLNRLTVTSKEVNPYIFLLYNIELFLIKKLEIMNTYVIVDGIVTILEWTVNING